MVPQASNNSLPENDEFDFVALVCCYLDNQLTPRQLAELNDQLRDNSEHRETFVRFCLQGKYLAEMIGLRMSLATDVSPTRVLSTPPPPFSFLSTAYHGSVNFFSQDVPFACLMSTIIVGFALVIASLVTKEHYTQMPGRSVASAERSFAAPKSDGADKARAAAKEQKEEVFQFVGRITGMVDCKWANPGRTFGSITDYSVALHDKYSLASGLMEITYDTGAKVILQGPVTYEVESANGGYMSVGKLTGKVEVEKAKGFVVRTPTAVITDLGTEFSVEVKADKGTDVCVFRGVVETQRDSRSGGTPVRERLVAGEAIQYVSGDAPPQRTTVNALHAAMLPSIKAISVATREARRSRLLRPTGLVATAYHRVWDANGKLLADNSRPLAFMVATDGIFGRGENDEGPRSSFDTLGGNGAKTDFVGLIYGHRVRIDRIKVFLGYQFGDGGDWQKLPRMFVLTNPDDPRGVPPENDPTNWRMLPPGTLSHGTTFDAKPNTNPAEVWEFILTAYPEEQRTGYGWAIGGVKGDGMAGYVSITELRAYGIVLKNASE